MDVKLAVPASASPSWLPAALTAALCLATVTALIAGNGNLALALAPGLVALLVVAICFLPLRGTVLVLLVLAWALEAPGDAFGAGLFPTPWNIVGRLLWGKLNGVIPIGALVVSGFDLLALLLFAVIAYRHARRSTLDTVGWVDAPPPLASFAWISVGAVLLMSAHGLVTGGSFRFILWQSTRWVYIPIVYLLMKQGLRGPRDGLEVGKLLLGVGLFRAGEAIVFRLIYPSTDVLPHATTHADSVLFATCVAILGALLLEMPRKRIVAMVAVLLPIFVWAIKANNRRLVWAELGVVALVFWIVSPWTPLKRKLARLAVKMALPLVLYGVVGWGSESVVFAPVRKVRSMTDSQVNTSTLWRDWENYDLVYTYGQAPLLGLGFGHPFIEKVKLPDVTAHYELEPYVPHNSVLGLWAFGGLVGFGLIWAVFPVGMFFAVRAYRVCRTPRDRVAALGAMAAQVCYVMQGYGDLGFGAWGPLFTLCASYAVVGKICLANGGWGPIPASVPVSGESPPPHGTVPLRSAG
ncbi:MAG TPA: hypothetical protein VLT82_01515 [Myxococcaceae bacterium]|nr:hypothetical protein [Myxococcaceae bacterium]